MMKANYKNILCLLTAICLMGCRDQQAWKESFRSQIPEEVNAFAQNYIELVRTRKYEDAIEILDPEIRTAKVRNDLKQASAYLDRGTLISIEPIGMKRSQYENREQDCVSISD